MIVGYIQKCYLNERDEHNDNMDYWIKFCEYYSSFMERVEDNSPRESVHLSNIDVDFYKTQNLKEFISDIIFIFEKILEDINEVLTEATQGPEGEDDIEPEIYNITQKNQETIPIIIDYYKNLLEFSENKSFEEINEFATYSVNNVNFTKEMNEAVEYFKSFIEIFSEKMREENEIISDWSERISTSLENMDDELRINNICKKFANFPNQTNLEIKNLIKIIKNLNELPKSINSINSKLNVYLAVKDSNVIIENLKSKIKEMQEMLSTMDEIFLKRNQEINNSSELDNKYIEICKEIKEKYNNNSVKWVKENAKTKEIISIFTFGNNKALYKSINDCIKKCEMYIPVFEDVQKSYEKAQEIINLQEFKVVS